MMDLLKSSLHKSSKICRFIYVIFMSVMKTSIQIGIDRLLSVFLWRTFTFKFVFLQVVLIW